MSGEREAAAKAAQLSAWARWTRLLATYRSTAASERRAQVTCNVTELCNEIEPWPHTPERKGLFCLKKCRGTAYRRFVADDGRANGIWCVRFGRSLRHTSMTRSHIFPRTGRYL